MSRLFLQNPLYILQALPGLRLYPFHCLTGLRILIASLSGNKNVIPLKPPKL